MRRRIDTLDRTHRHEFAAEQHADAIGEGTHHREIMRDEEHGHVAVGAQLGQQFEDIRLDRHVERREHLVADQQLRIGDQRARDGDALALAAGQFVGETPRIGTIEADICKCCNHACSDVVSLAKHFKRARQDGADAGARIE